MDNHTFGTERARARTTKEKRAGMLLKMTDLPLVPDQGAKALNISDLSMIIVGSHTRTIVIITTMDNTL